MNKPGRVEVQERPVPALREDGVLVHVRSVALNPTDWKVILSHAFLIQLTRETDAHSIMLCMPTRCSSAPRLFAA